MKQFVSFMLCLLAFSAASAQVTTSSMSGHVQDEQGAPVVGALVLATHTPSGTEYSAIVDGTGNYRIMNMRSGGPYSVKISMLGFQTVLNEGINIALGDNYVLDVTLPIESTDLDEVVVTGTRSSILNSDRAGVATNINNRQLNVLPTVSRSISDFTRLTPQAGNSGSFGGRDTRYNNVSIDGAAFAQRFGLSTSNNYPGGDAQPISLDAIQEISVNLTPFDIRQSNFTGANINAVTKSGDNSYHATAYTFQRFKSMTGDRMPPSPMPKPPHAKPTVPASAARLSKTSSSSSSTASSNTNRSSETNGSRARTVSEAPKTRYHRPPSPTWNGFRISSKRSTITIPAHTRISATRLRTTTKSWPASTGTSARTTS